MGTHVVTLTVTASNSSTSQCSANVTVEDNVAPMAVCQNITVPLDASGNATIVASDVDSGSDDACGVASLSADVTTFSCGNVGTNDVILTVTDVNGNISTCLADVALEDNVAPVAICQTVTAQLDASGNGSVTGAQLDGGSSDACGISSFTASPNTFDCSNVGSNNVCLLYTSPSPRDA
mgnify:FL=1